MYRHGLRIKKKLNMFQYDYILVRKQISNYHFHQKRKIATHQCFKSFIFIFTSFD